LDTRVPEIWRIARAKIEKAAAVTNVSVVPYAKLSALVELIIIKTHRVCCVSHGLTQRLTQRTNQTAKTVKCCQRVVSLGTVTVNKKVGFQIIRSFL